MALPADPSNEFLPLSSVTTILALFGDVQHVVLLVVGGVRSRARHVSLLERDRAGRARDALVLIEGATLGHQLEAITHRNLDRSRELEFDLVRPSRCLLRGDHIAPSLFVNGDHHVDVLERSVGVRQRALGSDFELALAAAHLLHLGILRLYLCVAIRPLCRTNGWCDASLTDGAIHQPGKQNAEDRQANAQALLPRSHSVGTG